MSRPMDTKSGASVIRIKFPRADHGLPLRETSVAEDIEGGLDPMLVYDEVSDPSSTFLTMLRGASTSRGRPIFTFSWEACWAGSRHSSEHVDCTKSALLFPSYEKTASGTA